MRVVYRTGLVAAAALAAGWAIGAADRKPDKSPHAEALELILRTQADEIRKIEAPGRIDGTGDELWWHDVKERTWVVKRPFGPGFIDSTHMFDVTYRIDGKDSGFWGVDTRKGTVTRVEAEKK